MSGRVCILSWFRNDENRRLEQRARHLMDKTYHDRRYVWVVGDSDDRTYDVLRNFPVEVVRHDTNAAGEDPESRMHRLTLTMNAALDHVNEEDKFCLVHESDLQSPPDVIERFLASGKCPVAGWPVLPTGPDSACFYDTFLYRKDGHRFSNYPPYHPCYVPDQPFEVDSAGSLLMFPAADVLDGLRSPENALIGFCAALRERGHRIWVDPRIEIVQPRDLFAPQIPANV